MNKLLLPCPFCGAKPRGEDTGDDISPEYSIFCTNEECGVSMSAFWKSEAELMWNKRVYNGIEESDGDAHDSDCGFTETGRISNCSCGRYRGD